MQMHWKLSIRFFHYPSLVPDVDGGGGGRRGSEADGCGEVFSSLARVESPYGSNDCGIELLSGSGGDFTLNSATLCVSTVLVSSAGGGNCDGSNLFILAKMCFCCCCCWVCWSLWLPTMEAFVISSAIFYQYCLLGVFFLFVDVLCFVWISVNWMLLLRFFCCWFFLNHPGQDFYF